MNASNAPITPADRLSFTLFMAVVLHALVIFGIGLARQISSTASTNREVTLSFHPSDRAPDDADFIAQANQMGSGSLDKKHDITTDQRSPFDADSMHRVNLTPPSTQHASKASHLVITSISTSTWQTPTKKASEDHTARPLPQSDKNQLQPMSRKIASLEARLAEQKQAYAKRPKVNFVDSVSAVAGYEARYINAFREEVEAVGTRHFPQKALKDNIFGNVRLRVDLLPNGHVRQIKLLHSSGHTLLDHAAIRSVRQAAPFAPFTRKMRQHYDVLAIIRTWKFDASSRLTSTYAH